VISTSINSNYFNSISFSQSSSLIFYNNIQQNMKLLFATSLLSLGHVAFGALKKPTTPPPLLGLCEYDCDVDADCKPGLLCADAHKPELKAAGFDERKANCGNVGAWNLEVCFDPAILKPSGGGGGGTCIITKHLGVI
jgi:hypothetical protein